MTNKKILKIRKRKIIVEQSDSYEDLTNLTVGLVSDISSFIVDSSKFWGNTLKLLTKASYYTFRAKILGNMSQEDFDQAFKTAKDEFVDYTNANISSMDNNIKSMLSSAGVSENELNTYLAGGLPSFNVLEKIDATKILTGRAYNKARYTRINPVEHSVLDLIFFFMVTDLSTKYKSNEFNNTLVKKIVIENKEIIKEVQTEIKTFLKSKLTNANALSRLETIKNKKSEKFLKVITGALNSNAYRSDRIKSEDIAQKFISKLATKLRGLKKSFGKDDESNEETESSTSNKNEIAVKTLNISNNNMSLLKEEDIQLDRFAEEFVQLVSSIATSIIWLDKKIKSTLLKAEAKKIAGMIEEKQTAEKIQNNQGDETDKGQELEKFIKTICFDLFYNKNQFEFLKQSYSSASNNDESWFLKIDEKYVIYYRDFLKKFGDISKNYEEFLTKKNEEFFSQTKEKIKEVKKNKEDFFKKNKKMDQEESEKIEEYFSYLKQYQYLQFLNAFLKDYKEESEKEKSYLEKNKKYLKEINEEKNFKDFLSKEVKELIQSCESIEIPDSSSLESDIEKSIKIAEEKYNELSEVLSSTEEKNKPADNMQGQQSLPI